MKYAVITTVMMTEKQYLQFLDRDIARREKMLKEKRALRKKLLNKKTTK